MIRRALGILMTVLLSAIVLAGVAWAVLALWLDGPDSKTLAGTLAVGLLLVSILLVALVRPFPRGLVAALLPIVAVAVCWGSIAPSNTRDWSPDVAHAARTTFEGPRVTI